MSDCKCPPAPAPDPMSAWAWQRVVVVCVTTLATTVASFFAGRATVDPPPAVVPAPPPMPPVPPLPGLDAGPGGGDAPRAMGWVADPEAVAAVVRTLPIKGFQDTPAAGFPTADLPKSVYGWKSYEQLFARPPPVKDQGQVGSCVAFGTNTAIERTLAAEIVRRKGNRDEWARFAEESTYGGSRVEIGGGRIQGDGSIGAWAADFVTKWGAVPRQRYDQLDLTDYSERLCRDWGRAGVPDWAEQVAKRFPVKSTTLVTSAADAQKSLAQGYFIAVCSNQGFVRQRDANGVARPSGSWAHCMAIDGYHTDDNGRVFFHIVNSWGGEFHTGPVGWGNPGPDGFWADAQTVDRMLRQRDSWAFSGVTGFPRRAPLDWFVQVEPVDPARRLALLKGLP